MSQGQGRKSEYRLIVQHVRADLEAPWHLIAYGNGRALSPCRFRSLDELTRRMRLAIPNCSPIFSATGAGRGESHILFSENICLDELQLSMLGFLSAQS